MKDFLLASIGRLDLAVWLLVILFFCGSALLFHGDLHMAFIGSAGIIVEMMLIGLSIEILIESLKTTKGIGTITGFITNGPEAICLIVGLVAGDIIFAASTPLGSNLMNPILLFFAATICGQLSRTFNTSRRYTVMTISLTVALAITFFFLPERYYLPWLLLSLIITMVLFFLRPAENKKTDEEETEIPSIIRWFIPSLLILTGAGYFLDPVVTFTSTHSHTPKGVIGFLVLATLTSWPEFKSCLALLARRKHLAAILNITVSNITNIWLALVGIGLHLLRVGG